MSLIAHRLRSAVSLTRAAAPCTVCPSRRLLHCSTLCLSGHNKWSTIKHDKAKNDAEKNKMANKFANAIAIAAKLGGPDPNQNIRLASAIEAASKANVLKRVIENAVKRGAGLDAGSKQSDQVLYEAVGPAGVAFVVEALTDNKNRTIGEVRSAFTKVGGSMSPSLFNFDRKGYVVCELPLKGLSEEEVFEKVIESGGEDYEVYANTEDDPQKDRDGNVVPVPDILEVATDPLEAGAVSLALKQDFKIKEVGIAYVPKPDLLVSIDNPDLKEKLEKLKQTLDDIDDVTDVYTNLAENEN